MTKDQADKINMDHYFVPYNLGSISDSNLIYSLFNQMQLGENRMTNSVRSALNSLGDSFNANAGGPFSIAEVNAINATNTKLLKGKFLDEQTKKFKSIASKNPSKAVYLNG